jgi:hypothetical protein
MKSSLQPQNPTQPLSTLADKLYSKIKAHQLEKYQNVVPTRLLEELAPPTDLVSCVKGKFKCLLERSSGQQKMEYGLDDIADHLFSNHYCTECVIHRKTQYVLFGRLSVHKANPKCSEGQVVTILQSEYLALLTLKKGRLADFDAALTEQKLHEVKQKVISLQKSISKLEETKSVKVQVKANLARDLDRRNAQVHKRGEMIRRRDREILRLKAKLKARKVLEDEREPLDESDNTSLSSDQLTEDEEEKEDEERHEDEKDEESARVPKAGFFKFPNALFGLKLNVSS